MAYTASPPTQAAFFEDRWAAEPSDDGKPRSADRNKARFSRRQPPRGRRAARVSVRFLITLGIGVGATLAWQYYGDDAKQMIANAFPQQLGRAMPQPSSPASATQVAPAATPPAAASVDRQQVKGLLLSLAVVNERVDQLATKLDFLQQEMAGEIAKLHASEQDILGKIATPPPPPPAAPAHKPAPRTPPPQPAPAH